MLWVIVLAISFIDMNVTCQILIQDNLFQFEFIVVSFFSLCVMFYRFLINFDRD